MVHPVFAEGLPAVDRALVTYNRGRKFLLGQLSLMEVGVTPVRDKLLLRCTGTGETGKGEQGSLEGLDI